MSGDEENTPPSEAVDTNKRGLSRRKILIAAAVVPAVAALKVAHDKFFPSVQPTAKVEPQSPPPEKTPQPEILGPNLVLNPQFEINGETGDGKNSYPLIEYWKIMPHPSYTKAWVHNGPGNSNAVEVQDQHESGTYIQSSIEALNPIPIDPSKEYDLTTDFKIFPRKGASPENINPLIRVAFTAPSDSKGESFKVVGAINIVVGPKAEKAHDWQRSNDIIDSFPPNATGVLLSFSIVDTTADSGLQTNDPSYIAYANPSFVQRNYQAHPTYRPQPA